MIKKLELNFGTIKIYEDNLLVSELKEGILFDVESNRQLLTIGTEAFKGKPYAYISNRINSYAVNPMVYRESADYQNLKAIAVVTNCPYGQKSAQVEQKFYKYKNSFEIFKTFEEAKSWVKRALYSY
ncbi:MAG TPA: hypothetical protein VFI78_01020 [Salinimicrobium sp.]|nr:hypothetical protein [Salinimicrobium sp.]